jgi:hypothetical protein
MVYTQAIVEGFRVIVRARGLELDYRVAASGTFRRCPGSKPADRGTQPPVA